MWNGARPIVLLRMYSRKGRKWLNHAVLTGCGMMFAEVLARRPNQGPLEVEMRTKSQSSGLEELLRLLQALKSEEASTASSTPAARSTTATTDRSADSYSRKGREEGLEGAKKRLKELQNSQTSAFGGAWSTGPLKKGGKFISITFYFD